MQVIPAVDLMDGRAVRLTKGDAARRTEYGEPEAALKRWAEEGADLIHVVDLDAALGRGSNAAIIERVLRDPPAKVQVGGGIRSEAAAAALLKRGAERVILGSLPFRDPDATRRLLAEYGADRIVVSLDHAGGRIKVAGWTSDAGATVAEALERFRTLEARLFLVTCIDRDGTLTGPDTDTVRRISSYTRVISAGGVSELSHLRELSGAGAEAAVVGKALYEGCFTLREAKEASL